MPELGGLGAGQTQLLDEHNASIGEPNANDFGLQLAPKYRDLLPQCTLIVSRFSQKVVIQRDR